jgi:hypothetical protein
MLHINLIVVTIRGEEQAVDSKHFLNPIYKLRGFPQAKYTD